MNIAMLSYHTCPLATLGGKDTGGMNVYVRDLTRELGRRGIHVDVFTRSQDEHVPHVLHDLGYGNRVVHVPAGPERPLPKAELARYLPSFVDGIRRFAAEKNIRYDLIHSHYWLSGLAAEALREAWGAPIVHMFHTLGALKNQVALSETEREGEYRLAGERRVVSVADRILVATSTEQEQLTGLYQADPARITVIPPGVDTCHFYPIPRDEARQYIGIPPQDRMVLYVGRIEPLKGIDTLIRAMACLRFQHLLAGGPVYLVIIGGDPDASPETMDAEMARLQALCADLQVHNMVIFLGKRGQDTLPYYYSAAEVVVVPSHYESFGMVALEAMVCGTPVIASAVGGLALLVRDGVTGYTVPHGDYPALCDKLIAILGNAALRQKLGRHAAVYARQYSWKKIAARIVNVYEALLNALSTDGARGALTPPAPAASDTPDSLPDGER